MFDFFKGLPTFPLNTDGVDPAGTNVHIRNLKITNFDDAVTIKPSHRGRSIAHCSQNILVENIHVVYGVGMSIGSVPTHDLHYCVKDVVFRNVTFETPLKAIYVKTNPGTDGTGEITNILYENITMTDPIWWAIYIGPQ